MLGANNANNVVEVAAGARVTVTMRKHRWCHVGATFKNKTNDCNVSTSYRGGLLPGDVANSGTFGAVLDIRGKSTGIDFGDTSITTASHTLTMTVGTGTACEKTTFKPMVSGTAPTGTGIDNEMFELVYTAHLDNKRQSDNRAIPALDNGKECSREVEQTVTVNNGTLTAEDVDLVDRVWGLVDCKYIVTLRSAQIPASLQYLPTKAVLFSTRSTTDDVRKQILHRDFNFKDFTELTEANKSVSLALDKVGTLYLRNVTAKATGGTMAENMAADTANALTVNLTKPSSCQASVPTVTGSPIAVGDMATVFLVGDSCDWNFNFVGGNPKCVFEYLPRRLLGGNLGGAQAMRTLTLTSVAEDDSTPDDMELSLVRKDDTNTGNQVRIIDLNVTSRCFTTFTPTINLEVDDTSRQGVKMASDYDDAVITATIAKAANEDPGCSGNTMVRLEVKDKMAAIPSDSPVTLINLPAGGTAGTDECDYEVTFAPSAVNAAFAKLTDAGSGAANLDADSPTVMRTYNAAAYGSADLWTLTVENDTAANSAGHDDADQRTVRLTFKRAGTAAGCNGASVLGRNGADNQDDIAPASSEMYTFRKSADCKVTLNFANKPGNCQVSYADPDASSTTLNSKQNNDVSIASSTTGLTHGTGTAKTALTLEMTVGECTDSFEPQPSVTITETAGAAANAHDNETITVTYTRASNSGRQSGCTARATQVLTVTNRMTSAAPLSLVDVPDGGTDGTDNCSYNVSFESPVTSGDFKLVDAGTGTPVVNAASPGVTRAYNSVTDKVKFNNTETTGASNGIDVAIPRSGCPETPPPTLADSEVEINSSISVQLPAKVCDFIITATHKGNTCEVDLQPKKPGDIAGSTVAVGSAVTGVLTLQGSVGAGVLETSSRAKIIEVDMSLERCETKFTPSVTVTVTESRPNKVVSVHDQAMIPVTYTPVAVQGLANCSPRTVHEMMLNSSGTSSSVPSLVDQPKGWKSGAKCSYRVSFGPVDSDGATLVDAGTGTPTVSQGSAAVTRMYGVVTDSVTFRNTGGVPAGINMRVTRGSGCPTSTAIPTIASPIAFNSSTTARLGMATCAWNIMATSVDETCVVSLQPKSAGGSNVGTVVVDDTLVLNGQEGSGVTRTGYNDKVISVDLSVVRCRSIFTPYVSVSVTDTLEGAAVSDHDGVVIRASLVPVSATGALRECDSDASLNLTIVNRAASSSRSAALVNLPKGGTSNCQYRVSLPSSLRSGSKVLRLTTTGQLTVSAASPSVSAAYTAEEVPVTPVTLTVGVASAASVDEGNPLVFPVSLSQVTTQAVTVNYTVGGASDSVNIPAGQLSTEISVPTDDDDLDEANQTVRVTLTSATGGASLNPTGRTATGTARDNDPSPKVGIEAATIEGNRLRVTVALSEESGRDVQVDYATSLGANGKALIRAGQLRSSVSRVFTLAALAEADSVRLWLPSAQYATVDVHNRERLLFPGGGGWQFQVVTSSTTAAEIARGLGLGDNWQLYSWSTASQRWIAHTAASGEVAFNTSLSVGTTITYRGAEASASELTAAGLGRSDELTLRPGWNIFTPAQGAVGLTRDDFTSAAGGGSAVIFDSMLVNCETTAGTLAIYTYDQSDPHAAGGFRLALPCHQQALASSGIPAITSIDERDTFYVWFRNDATVELSFANDRYSPAT